MGRHATGPGGRDSRAQNIAVDAAGASITIGGKVYRYPLSARQLLTLARRFASAAAAAVKLQSAWTIQPDDGAELDPECRGCVERDGTPISTCRDGDGAMLVVVACNDCGEVQLVRDWRRSGWSGDGLRRRRERFHGPEDGHLERARR